MTEAALNLDTLARNLGPQPLAKLLAERGLKPADLVAAVPVGLTFKMLARACKGRRLTRHAQTTVLTAFNRAAGTNLALRELFTYEA
ncbi:MAG: hypothetical protein K9N49_02000 [Candidatus Marinimicrobia bacterium]|nr:hypothetical protein [Candidatus Neomarinimicrobiota bacterium]